MSESSRGPSDFPSKKETLSSGLSCTASNLPSSSPLKTGSPHNLPSHENSVSSQEQIVERAKQVHFYLLYYYVVEIIIARKKVTE